MSGFPLYDDLMTNIQTKDLNIKEKEEFIRLVRDLNSHGREMVYTLVYTYNNTHDKIHLENLNHIPYGGAVDEVSNTCRNISWNFNRFPAKLKQLLYKFITMHTNN